AHFLGCRRTLSFNSLEEHDMVDWIFRKLKSLFLIAAVGGPVVSAMMWWDAQHIREVDQRGIVTAATIDGATRTKRRRSGTSYSVNLSWKDGKGQVRAASDVSISNAFAAQIIRDGRIVRNDARIKYLVEDMEAKPILLEDAAHQLNTDRELIWVGLGAGVIGALGSGFFFMGRRQKPEEA
ncbi:MAG: hypothetical protein R3D67_21480, partial [Hyphomicrobiaceae bacterium]